MIPKVPSKSAASLPVGTIGRHQDDEQEENKERGKHGAVRHRLNE